MIPALAAGTVLLLAAPVFAQSTGTSHPEDLNDSITVAAPQNSVVTVTTPAPAAPALHARPETEVYVATPSSRPAQTAVPADEVYRPYHPAQTAEVVHPATPAIDPADAGIVTSVPFSETELLEGTIIKTRLIGQLSTTATKPGSHFVATLTHNVEHGGRVIFPVGASLEGRVTEVRSGRRISGGAAIHLEPETVTLPDGVQYHLNARLVDLDSGHSSKVNDEGTITGGSHTARTVTTFGASTGSGLIAGAVIAGAPGAAVGAGVGAGVGTILWLKEDRQQTLPEGTELVFSLNRPMDLTPSIPVRR
jgi:hypothetical protein